MDSTQKDKETIYLRNIIIDYIRNWKVFLIAALISLIPAILYLVFYPRTYEFMSKIKIQEDKGLGSSGIGLGEAAGLMKSFGIGGSGSGVVNIDDEIATLSSNWLLKKAILKLGLNVSYEKPFSFRKLYLESPIYVLLDSISQERLDRRVSFEVKLQSDASVLIKETASGKKFVFGSLPAQIILPEGTFDFLYRDSLHQKSLSKLNVTVSPASWVAEDLINSIVVEEYSKSSNTIELTYTDHSKKRGVDFLNVLMDEYNTSSSFIKTEEGTKAMTFLEGRINGVLEELNKIEYEIEAYKIKNKMTDIESDILYYTDALKSLREKIIGLESQSYIIKYLDTYVKNPDNQYNLIPAMLSVGEGDNGSAISVYNEALIERDKIKKSSKEGSPLAELADNQVDKLRGSVILAIGNAYKATQQVLGDLKLQEKTILDKMGYVPTFEREFLDYKRQQEILQGIYLILLQKKEEIALSLGKEREKGYVLDSAYAKYKSIAPRKLYALLFVIIFTILIPIIYLFVRDRLKELIIAYKQSI